MDHDHYAPPQAFLEDVPSPSTGPLVPFEDKAVYPDLGTRILETFRWILRDRERAGEAFRGTDGLGSPLWFMCLLGYLPAVIPGLLAVFLPRTPFWMAWLNLSPGRPAQGFLLVVAVVSVLVFAPVGLLIGGLVGGLLNHAGLWMAQGTRHGHGLSSSLRSTLYTAGVLAWILFPFNLGKSLPGFTGLVFQVLAGLLLFLLPTTYQGIMLARTHRVETWRGVAGAWIPGLIFLFCLGSCLGLAFWFAGDSIMQAIRQARPGMF